MSLHGTPASRKRLKLIQEANAKSISNLIKDLPSVEAKKQLILECNPYHYIFGEKLNPKGEIYEEETR